MSDELMNRARGLLALRDKATPGPWEADLDSRYVWTAGMAKCVNASGYDGETLTAADAQFIRAAHDMADTIADLLAEVERLTIRESALSDAHVEIHGHRFACSQAVANYVQQINDQRVTAESRLRELASAEPVGYCTEGMGIISRKAFGDFMIPLIRRPEMK